MNWPMFNLLQFTLSVFPISMGISKDKWPVDVNYADAEMFVENSYCAPGAS